jgi:hypothetical protein
MTIRTDIISVDWSQSPRVAWIDISVTECSAQDLYDTLRHLEAQPEAVDEPPIVDAGGGEPLGGGVFVGLTVSLFNAVYAFAARPGPEWVVCNMTGGNVVAFEDYAKTIVLYPRMPTAYVSADRTAASSATSQQQSLLEHTSFNGSVTIDFINGFAGTGNNSIGNPIGTDLAPSNNWTDALAIANARGFREFSIIGNATVSGALDLDDFRIVGQSVNKTLLTLEALASTQGLEVENATVTGIIDGANHIHNSIIVDLTYVNGDIINCGLIGDIELSGDGTFNDCYTVDQDDPPTINMGGNHSLAMPNYSGLITITNLTSVNEEVGIGLNAGMVVLDSSITAGTVIVSGVGIVTDNTTGAAVVDATSLISNDAVANAVWAYERP